MIDRRSFLSCSAAAGLTTAFPGVAAADGKRPPRILLKSGWQTVNIGDVAHTPGMLRLLADHHPTAEVTLWPNGVGADEEAMLRRHFPKLVVVRTPDAVKAAFDANDFFLHSSGPSLVAAKSMAEWKAKTGKPYGVLGITLGSIDAATHELLDGAKFLYLRDSGSVKVATDAKLKCPVVDLGPDAAFAVSARDDTGAAAYLKAVGLDDGRFLCAIPRLRNSPYWIMRNKPMTDLDRAKDAENNTLKEQDHAGVRAALVAVLRETPYKVLVCPEDKSHVAVGKEMFVDRFPADVRGKVVWRDQFWPMDLAVGVYAKAVALVSMDMHSPIMAVGNGTPAVHFRFKQQTSKGLMWRDIGLGDWLFDLDANPDAADITKAVLGIAKDPAAARKKAADAQAFVRGKHAEAMAVLGKALPR